MAPITGSFQLRRDYDQKGVVETTGSFGNHLHQTILATDYLYKDRLFNGEFSREELIVCSCPLTNQNLASIVGVARYS